MIFPRLIGFAALSLAGCSEVDRAEPPSPVEGPTSSPAAVAQTPAEVPTTTPPANVAVTEAGELVGEYRVAGVDGEALNAPVGVAVSINKTTISLLPCAGYVWRYTYAAGKLETEPAPGPSDTLCAPTREVAAVGAALNGANRVARTPSNGLEFSGGGHSVLLFSQ